MNKLRRNNSHFRFTVENMGYLCSSDCEMHCFMISCICDSLNQEQNDTTYTVNHRDAAEYGNWRLEEFNNGIL